MGLCTGDVRAETNPIVSTWCPRRDWWSRSNCVVLWRLLWGSYICAVKRIEGAAPEWPPAPGADGESHTHQMHHSTLNGSSDKAPARLPATGCCWGSAERGWGKVKHNFVPGYYSFNLVSVAFTRITIVVCTAGVAAYVRSWPTDRQDHRTSHTSASTTSPESFLIIIVSPVRTI